LVATLTLLLLPPTTDGTLPAVVLLLPGAPLPPRGGSSRMAWPPRRRSALPSASPLADRVAAATRDASASACGPPSSTPADPGRLPPPLAAITSSRSGPPTDSDERATLSVLSPS